MKRIICIVLTLVLCVSVLSVSVVTSNAAITGGSRAVSFDWRTPSLDGNSTRLSDEIILTIYPLKDVPTYRYYYKICDISGNSTGWVRAGEISSANKSAINVSFTIKNSYINGVSTKGIYSNNSIKATENPSPRLMIFFTVRGLKNGSFVTGYYSSVYTTFMTSEFCCQTAPCEDFNHWNRTVSVYLPDKSFAQDDIYGVRFYYRAKNGSWKTITTKYRNFFYSPTRYRYAVVGCQVPWNIVKDMKVDKDGDICLTARCVNKYGNPISPYYNQYWNYNQFVS